MLDILSPSPYAYLDDLPPAERQAAIRLRQHRANAESGSAVNLARRARDYQAENAALKSDMHAVFGNACDQRDAALARIAELEAALEPFVEFADMVEEKYRKRGGNPDIFPDGHPFVDIQAKEIRMGYWRSARAALRNR